MTCSRKFQNLDIGDGMALHLVVRQGQQNRVSALSSLAVHLSGTKIHLSLFQTVQSSNSGGSQTTSSPSANASQVKLPEL